MLGSLVLALLAWAALYTAMDRPRLAQYKAVDHNLLVIVLRATGALLLLLSLICSMQSWGTTVGFAAWWVILTVTGVGFTLWHSLRRKRG